MRKWKSDLATSISSIKKQYKRVSNFETKCAWKLLRLANNSYLTFRQSPFISDKQQIALSLNGNLFLEASTFFGFILQIGASQIPMNQSGLARRNGTNNALQKPFQSINRANKQHFSKTYHTQIGYSSADCPLLTVHKRIWSRKKKIRFSTNRYKKEEE